MREEEWRIEAITAGQVRASRPGQRRVLGFCTPQDYVVREGDVLYIRFAV